MNERKWLSGTPGAYLLESTTELKITTLSFNSPPTIILPPYSQAQQNLSLSP